MEPSLTLYSSFVYTPLKFSFSGIIDEFEFQLEFVAKGNSIDITLKNIDTTELFESSLQFPNPFLCLSSIFAWTFNVSKFTFVPTLSDTIPPKMIDLFPYQFQAWSTTLIGEISPKLILSYHSVSQESIKLSRNPKCQPINPEVRQTMRLLKQDINQQIPIKNLTNAITTIEKPLYEFPLSKRGQLEFPLHQSKPRIFDRAPQKTYNHSEKYLIGLFQPISPNESSTVLKLCLKKGLAFISKGISLSRSPVSKDHIALNHDRTRAFVINALTSTEILTYPIDFKKLRSIMTLKDLEPMYSTFVFRNESSPINFIKLCDWDHKLFIATQNGSFYVIGYQEDKLEKLFSHVSSPPVIQPKTETNQKPLTADPNTHSNISPSKNPQNVSNCTGVDLSCNLQYLYAQFSNGVILIFSLASQPVKVSKVEISSVSDARSLCYYNNFLYFICDNTQIAQFNLETLNIQHKFSGFSKRISDFLVIGEYLIIVSSSGAGHIFHVFTHEKVQWLGDTSNSTQSLMCCDTNLYLCNQNGITKMNSNRSIHPEKAIE